MLLNVNFAGLITFFFGFLRGFLRIEEVISFGAFRHLRQVFREVIFVFPFVASLFLVVFTIIGQRLVVGRHYLIRATMEAMIYVCEGNFLTLFTELHFG